MWGHSFKNILNLGNGKINLSSSVTLDVLGSDVVEVGVFQGFFHGDAASWVQLKHLYAEIQGDLVEVLEEGIGVDTFELGESWLEVRQIMDVHPLCWGWGSVELEDFEDLIDLTISTEKRLLLHQLSEDAANCPDVNS